jgi:hypothetical protein
MIYQSMSGDAASGTSSFTMTGGILTSKNGHVFHVTNTTATIDLNGVTIVNEDAENILLSVCADGWTGDTNKATLNASSQALEGTILVGSDSELTLNLTDGSSFEGTIDGNGSLDTWWPMCGHSRYGWTEAVTESQRESRPELLRMAEDGVDLSQRQFGKGKGLRPQLINLYECENILLEGVTLLRSPFWVVHPLLSKNIIVRGLTIINDGPNGDGCDPESCKDVLIENCRVSATLTSTVTGDATMGGFVGNANYAALLTLRNCKFDGSFEGENCNSNGGMVGWSNKLVTIENCVFAPQHIGTQYGDCATWARIREQSGLTVINSYRTELFEERYKDVFYINSADDWNSFVSTLASANGEALINVIMTADISVNTTTPSNVYWKGTFDGNGHTLNVNIDKPGDIFIAPFIGAKNYTIKNLHVTGTVNGAKH